MAQSIRMLTTDNELVNSLIFTIESTQIRIWQQNDYETTFTFGKKNTVTAMDWKQKEDKTLFRSSSEGKYIVQTTLLRIMGTQSVISCKHKDQTSGWERSRSQTMYRTRRKTRWHKSEVEYELAATKTKTKNLCGTFIEYQKNRLLKIK